MAASSQHSQSTLRAWDKNQSGLHRASFTHWRYRKVVKATQPAIVTTGSAGAGLHRITLSCVEQKLRSPTGWARRQQRNDIVGLATPGKAVSARS